jgi:hypothetical protein
MRPLSFQHFSDKSHQKPSLSTHYSLFVLLETSLTPKLTAKWTAAYRNSLDQTGHVF